MKSFSVGCILALVLMAGVAIASATPADYSGTWVLDKSKSDGLPRQLQNVESYTLTVTQDDKQITVDHKIVAAPRSADDQGGSGDPGGRRRQDAGQSGGQGAGQGGGMGRRGGFGGQGGRGGRGGLGMNMPTATYKLDGAETKIESTDPRGGGGTLKAQWKNDGKVLDLTNTRSFNIQGNEVTRTTKERWELADGGKTLKVKRTVDTQQGSQESTLVFTKQ